MARYASCCAATDFMLRALRAALLRQLSFSQLTPPFCSEHEPASSNRFHFESVWFVVICHRSISPVMQHSTSDKHY
jgi:hypothetical protein